jgi:hypothetical protein
MSKMSDLLKQALDKKRGTSHVELDGTPTVDKKSKKAPSITPGKKPPTRSAGRGR